VWQLWHLALLAVSSLSLGFSGLRIASRLTTFTLARIFGGAVIAVAAVVLESLALGLFGLGSNAAVLTGSAIATWLICWRTVPPATGPPLRTQLAASWRDASPLQHAGVGASLTAGLGWTIYLAHNPAIGFDGLAYHLTEPAIWVTDGRPGSMHPTIIFPPVEAYPRTMEVLYGWALALGRTAVVTVPITVGCFALLALALLGGLRSLRVSFATSCLAPLAIVLMPVVVVEGNGVLTDIPALTWLACAGLFAAVSFAEPPVSLLAFVAVGLSIGTKTTTGPLAVLLVATVLWQRRAWLREHLAATGLSLAIAVGVGGLWYLIDWATYGALFYPFSGFPSGQLPSLFSTNLYEFASHPIADFQAIGWQAYLRVLGGGFVILAGVVLTLAVAALSHQRRAWRQLAVGGSAVGFLLLIWAYTPVTAEGTGLRYILPAPLVAASVLGLATRYGRWLRWSAVACLLVSVLVDLLELRFLGYPYRPGMAMAILVPGLGALVGTLIGIRPVRVPSRLARVLPAILAAAGILLLAIPAQSFESRHLEASQSLDLGDANLVTWFEHQPGWTQGSSPITVGPMVFATLAGPRFSHPLSYISNSEPCAQIQSIARRGWAVVQTLGAGTPQLSELQYNHPTACMAGLTPLVVLPGTGYYKGPIRIYGPASFGRPS